ncbi:glycosyl hydrolase [Xanthomonas arboricola]|uniref:glycoside hydrolase family 3 protein n=1 Tax=Xanthomonas arboricola TaxID=56448 RepID=UPI00061A21BF|nr:glycoside hydrolase family 3 C-terminal domain-containing protein [Xanthomonas arboricola]AKC78785.1 glycosyl hydrolase [Xanthomonas arboricola]
MTNTKVDFEEAVALVRTGAATSEAAADRLLGQMSDKELLWLLDGDVPRLKVFVLPKLIAAGPVSAGRTDRLGIPGIRFSDGPRGVVMGASTAFPVTMARAATWDPALEERVGLAMGREARAQGANYSGAVCVNLLRHPAWGRAQECYGEDPVLIGRMGAALTAGLRPNVMACVKHFALNSMENARFSIDVQVAPHPLHEVYLPHFKAVIEAGAESVMSAYNKVNGQWAGDSRPLLTDILRNEWGFKGFVTSDWVWGLHDPVRSLEAGDDIEMPARLLRARTLPKALRDGRLPRAAVLAAGRRILATQLRHYAGREAVSPERSVVAGTEHRALARLVAARGAVLLKNDSVAGTPVLPLDVASLRRVAVIGRLATEANIGDHGSSLVHPPVTCSPLAGLREALPGVEVVHADGTDPAAAARLAAGADVALLVAGMTHDDEGERVSNENVDGTAVFGFPFTWGPVKRLLKKLSSGSTGQFGRGGDRARLTLAPEEEELILAVSSANPRTVVVLIGGSALLMESWRGCVPSILMAWYPGMEGGRAIADVLTGAQDPGGRLPFAIPRDPAHLPFFDAEATSIVYDEWWGQRKLDRDGHAAAFRFGHGLGYTGFELKLAGRGADGTATVAVRNTGARHGATTIQLYAFDAEASPPIAQLVGFRRVELAAGTAASVAVALDHGPLQQRDPDTAVWSPRPGAWRLVASTASPDVDALATAMADGRALPW